MAWAAELAVVMSVMAGFDTDPSIDAKQTLCLAQNIYHEARQESIRGQRGVAEVTLNRLNSGRFGDTVCEVVYAKKKVRGVEVAQFSWVTDEPHVNLDNPIDRASFELASELALMALSSNAADPVYMGGAMFYYNPNKVTPNWSRGMLEIAMIGNHRFMTDEE